tara:strand:+ start:429 stop:821 length:393 start_codon:yes stop_codon:yes gene_type:complete
MEFRKREVKKPEIDPNSEMMMKGNNPTPPPPPYAFDGKVLTVSVVCEVFDVPLVKDAEMKCPIQSVGRNYTQNTRTRTMLYDVSEGANTLKQITRYWNEWKDVGTGSGRKIRFAIRKNPAIIEEESIGMQ